jgi:hypothetical protein
LQPHYLRHQQVTRKRIKTLPLAKRLVQQQKKAGILPKKRQAVGNKTAEVASKGASAVADKKYDEKVGPQGQTIYIDKNSYYYYVNKKGHHIYVPKTKLVDKPAK